MNNSNTSNKLVTTTVPPPKTKTTIRDQQEQQHRIRVDEKLYKKFVKKVKTMNKGKDNKHQQITLKHAANQAIVLWMEKNPI